MSRARGSVLALVVMFALAVPAEGAAPVAVGRDRYGDPLPAGAIARLGTVRFRHGGAVNGVAFMPDGKGIVSCSDDGTLSLWDADTGVELRRFVGHRAEVKCMALSPDGKLLASGGEREGAFCPVRIWSVESGKQLRVLDPAEAPTALTFSPDGLLLASAGRRIQLWQVSTGKELRRLEGPEEAVSSIAFTPDGKGIVSNGAGGVIRFWDVSRGRETGRVKADPRGVAELALSSDGKSIAIVGIHGGLRLWDGAGKHLHNLAEGKGPLWRLPLAFSPDGKTLAWHDGFGPLRLFAVKSGRVVRSFAKASRSARAVAFSPDGMRLATGGSDSTVRVWNAAWGFERSEKRPPTEGISSLSLSPDGRLAPSTSQGSSRAASVSRTSGLRRRDRSLPLWTGRRSACGRWREADRGGRPSLGGH